MLIEVLADDELAAAGRRHRQLGRENLVQRRRGPRPDPRGPRLAGAGQHHPRGRCAQDPRTPIPAVNIALGLFAGLLTGLALAALREALDTTITGENDVHEVSGLPTLAMIPTNGHVADSPVLGVSSAGSAWGEAFRKLRTNLSYVDPDHPADVIAVASALPCDGKSLTAINLVASLAQNGRRAVLVEADLRRPSLAGPSAWTATWG